MCKERNKEKQNATKTHLWQLHNSFVTFVTGFNKEKKQKASFPPKYLNQGVLKKI